MILRACLLVLIATASVGACRGRVPAGAATPATAMGSWPEWRHLGPLVEVARDHAPAPAVSAIDRASKLLRDNKARSADAVLASAADGAGAHWIAVARGDLAALHFTLCVRGVAWRLRDGESPRPTERKADFSEQTRIEPGDVSVEAVLTNLDAAVGSGEPTLVTQARIARARAAAFAQQCAATEQVATLAQGVVEADLATLAAEGHLTPDLAYMWAGVQMSRFSGAAARPFLLQAREGGFTHPAVTFMLAVIALENRELQPAEELAREATQAYREVNDRIHEAEGLYLQGEIAVARKQPKLARQHYDAALALEPSHGPTVLAIAELEQAKGGEDSAIAFLSRALRSLLLQGPLDEQRLRHAADNLEGLVTLAVEPLAVQLLRDALLASIDAEVDPARRGLRYFFAGTLDVRLREYELAHGHGVLAKEEFAAAEINPPMDIEAFLAHVSEK